MTRAVGRNILHWLQEESRSGRLLPALTSGALIGMTEVIFALSLGSLIFSGELAPLLPYGIGIALATATIMLAVTALASSVPGVMGSTQDTTSVVLAVIASALIGALSAANPQSKLATILVAISITTLLTGLFLLALGAFKLGKLVRFPVSRRGQLFGRGDPILTQKASVMGGLAQDDG